MNQTLEVGDEVTVQIGNNYKYGVIEQIPEEKAFVVVRLNKYLECFSMEQLTKGRVAQPERSKKDIVDLLELHEIKDKDVS